MCVPNPGHAYTPCLWENVMSDLFLNASHRCAGSIKFDSSIPVETLCVLIMDLKSMNRYPWVDLHVRGAGDDGTHYIGFHYKLQDGTKRSMDEMVHRIMQFLRDRLGTQPRHGRGEPRPMGVIGWSIATVEAFA